MRSKQALVRSYLTGNAADKAGALEELTAIVAEEVRAAMAPPGGIPGLPPLLEARRLEYGIVDGAFKIQAAFNVCLVKQVPWFAGDKIPGTDIYMPKTTEKRILEEAPRGILISAGLQALDHLRSNGIDIGHMVSLIRLAPWRMPVEMVKGKEEHVLILRSGDITGSEDLRRALVAGECRIEWSEEHQQHLYVDQAGHPWKPTVPFLPEDY